MARMHILDRWLAGEGEVPFRTVCGRRMYDGAPADAPMCPKCERLNDRRRNRRGGSAAAAGAIAGVILGA